MLTKDREWVEIIEVNPPILPDMSHLLLDGVWTDVLVTDNVFGKIRVSPYAYAARITHDSPTVHPTVVVSTRDRNILAIESEVRGALGNGVNSFLVVVGDTFPAIDHMAHHYEIVEHLTALQAHTPEFEVGMPTRFQEWQFRRRIDLGTQFFVTGPVIDPASVAPNLSRLRLKDGDPPVFLMVIPPFSLPWVERMEGIGGMAVTSDLKRRLEDTPPDDLRGQAWELAAESARQARNAGAAGIVLMGLKFQTVVDEAAQCWRRVRPGLSG